MTVIVAAATASSYAWTISWIGFGLSDQLLLMRYPWGKVRYPLFGYLGYGFDFGVILYQG